MSDGGKKRFTASMPAGGDPTKPGWRNDPERPGIQRYWDGSTWADDIAPRAKPDPTWKQARIVVLAILVAAAAIFMFVRLQGPSDAECLDQASAVLRGERFTIDDGCR